MNPRALLLLSLLSPIASAQTEVWIEIRDIDLVNKNFTVHADLAADVAGFQFDLTGVEVTGTHGGLAGDAAFQTSFNCDTNLCHNNVCRSCTSGFQPCVFGKCDKETGICEEN